MSDIFGRVQGHQKIKTTLMESLSRDAIPPSFVFAGPSGVGKQLIAQGWAQVLLCTNRADGESACGQCASCLQVLKKSHSNLIWIEPEKTSIKLDQMKEMIRNLSLQQWSGRRVIVIHEAQLLNPQAGNAILKIVEEPPEDTHFVFVTSSYFSLLPTLRSRSQRMSFHPLEPEDLAAISGQSGWVLKSAQGRMDLLEKLTGDDYSEYRSRAAQFFHDLQTEKTWSELSGDVSDIVKDKEVLGFFILVWKQMIRDSFLIEPQQKIHQDISDPLTSLDDSSKHRLFELFEKLEKALMGHADPVLGVESTVIRAKEAMGVIS